MRLPIGFEKRWNAALAMAGDAFIRDQTANIPSRPAGIDRMVAINAGE